MAKHTATPTAPDMPVLKITHELLPCQLLTQEAVERGKNLAAALDAINSEDARQAFAKHQMKQALAVLEARRDELRVIVSTGEEPREIEVHEVADYEAGKALRIRGDTHKIIGERLLTAHERQEPLPFDFN